MITLKNWQESIDELTKNNVELPQYDVADLKAKGQKAPVWIHFGGGNLYRGFHGEIAQRLADQGELSSGVVVCETFDNEVVEKAYNAYHNDFLEVVMHEDGSLDKRLIAATAASFYCNPADKDNFSQVISYFENPALQFTTFTITEKGYALKDPAGNYFPVVIGDIENGPVAATHTISIVTALLLKRFLAGAFPIAMVSTDNFSQNGQRFQESILTIANEWEKAGFVSKDFISYLTNPEKVSFPWSMIDRITPNPSTTVEETLNQEGFCDMEIIHTSKGTNIAAFANTEVIHYLVLEDSFPNGRPALEKAGVIVTDRQTVDKADVMKVTTCLNPLHTALAVTGCLLGYTSIASEMKDRDLVGLIKGIGYQEGLPVVANPGIIDPKQFIDELLQKRLPNPNIPDAPQRIASDTSQKVAIRFGETIKRYEEQEGKSAASLIYIPVAIAAWLRYLLAVDDKGQAFTPSPDPLLSDLQAQLAGITLGEQSSEKIHQATKTILANATIFGSDLYQVGLGVKIEGILKEMLVGVDAVRNTIHAYVTKGGNN